MGRAAHCRRLDDAGRHGDGAGDRRDARRDRRLGKTFRQSVLVTLGNIYTTVFRGVPELLIIYLIYFGGSSAVTAIGTGDGL